jgi:hypothetical protein
MRKKCQNCTVELTWLQIKIAKLWVQIDIANADARIGSADVNMFGAIPDVSKMSSLKKSQVYVAPLDITEHANVSFKLIEAGSVFCTTVNCTVAYHGGAVITVNPGEIFVTTSLSEAFVEPRMFSLNFDEQALQYWMDITLYFEA